MALGDAFVGKIDWVVEKDRERFVSFPLQDSIASELAESEGVGSLPGQPAPTGGRATPDVTRNVNTARQKKLHQPERVGLVIRADIDPGASVVRKNLTLLEHLQLI